MKKFKRALAALAASAMMFTMSGCSDTRYAMTYDNGTKVNAGVYIYNLYMEMSYQLSMTYYTTGTMDLDLDGDMDGQKLRDYLVEKARTATKEFAAVTYQFEKLGLSLTDDETKQVSDNLTEIWDSSGDLLEEEGISKESVRQVLKSQIMRTRLFEYYYGEGGAEEASDADLQKYVEDNYIRYKTIRINRSTAEDETEAAKEDEENKAVRDEFLAKAEGVDFDGFDSIIDEYDEYLKAQLEEDTTGEEDGMAGPVLSEDTDTAVDAPVDDEDSDDEMTTETEDEEVEDDETESSPNEMMLNYGDMSNEMKETNTGKLGEFMNGIEVGKAQAYEDENYYYIVIKGDITENSADYASDNHDSLLQTMKGDDFQSKIDSWIEEIGITENTDAIKRYTAQVVYDKQIEFYGY